MCGCNVDEEQNWEQNLLFTLENSLLTLRLGGDALLGLRLGATFLGSTCAAASKRIVVFLFLCLLILLVIFVFIIRNDDLVAKATLRHTRRHPPCRLQRPLELATLGFIILWTGLAPAPVHCWTLPKGSKPALLLLEEAFVLVLVVVDHVWLCPGSITERGDALPFTLRDHVHPVQLTLGSLRV
jgi:uncharacterized integral membrane protein